MDNQKIENQLNLAIEATPQERSKSMDLDVGFNQETATWEVIVKFYGTEEELRVIFERAFPAHLKTLFYPYLLQNPFFENISLLFALVFEQFDVTESILVTEHRHFKIGDIKSVKEAVYEKIRGDNRCIDVTLSLCSEGYGRAL